MEDNLNRHPQWTVRWVTTRSGFQRYLVWTKEGIDYVRTPDPALADVVISDWATKGLPPLHLKRKDKATAHLRKAVA